MDLLSIRSTLEDYNTQRPKGICCSVKQVYSHSSSYKQVPPIFCHLYKIKSVFKANSYGTFQNEDANRFHTTGPRWLGAFVVKYKQGGKNCMSLLIC